MKEGACRDGVGMAYKQLGALHYAYEDTYVGFILRIYLRYLYDCICRPTTRLLPPCEVPRYESRQQQFFTTMPLYEIHHSCSLSSSQRDDIAAAITSLHCRLFSAPSIFVNVIFHQREQCFENGKMGDLHGLYVGGQKRRTNYIIGHIRPRGDQEKLKMLVQGITKIWNLHGRSKCRLEPRTSGRAQKRDAKDLERADADAPGRLDDHRALHNCFIMEDIAGGSEQGFMLPVAGQDGNWIKDNMPAFEKRAAEGDKSMQGLLAETKAGLGTGPAVKSQL